jgi:hypothetical protein
MGTVRGLARRERAVSVGADHVPALATLATIDRGVTAAAAAAAAAVAAAGETLLPTTATGGPAIRGAAAAAVKGVLAVHHGHPVVSAALERGAVLRRHVRRLE